MKGVIDNMYKHAAQVKMRADRVGVLGHNLYLMPITDLDEIIVELEL